jgi:3-hydroxybutyryl-CoA dehydrogenase
MKKIGSIAVCGAGTMGRGIAQAAIQSGFDTILFDTNEEILKAAAEEISRSLFSLVQKGKISEEEKNNALNKLRVTSDINGVKAELIIEAIIEKIEAKKSLLVVSWQVILLPFQSIKLPQDYNILKILQDYIFSILPQS